MNDRKIKISAKIAWIAAIIPFIGVSLALVLENAADAVILQKDSYFNDLLKVYFDFMAFKVVPLQLIFGTFLYFFTKKIENVTNRLQNNESVLVEELESIKKRLFIMPIIITILNIVAYFLGALLYISAKGQQMYLSFYIFFPMSSSIIYSFLQITFINQVLKKTRELLHVHYMENNKKKHRNVFGLRLKSIMLVAFTVIYASSFIIAYQVKAFNLERYNASLLEGVIDGKITLEQAKANFLKEPLDGSKVLPLYTEAYTKTFQLYLGLYGIIFIFLVIIGIIIQTSFSLELTTQIKMQKERISDIIEGGKDLTKRLNLIQFDEVGILSDKINRLMDKVRNIFLKFFLSADNISKKTGSLDKDISEAFTSMETTLDGILHIDSNTKAQKNAAQNARNEIKNITDEISKISINVDNQAVFIEDTAGAMTEVASNINSINELTSKTASLSNNLVTVANAGETSIDGLTDSIKNIEQSSNMVMEVIQVISEIASQSDILAINAAIEAAHAGESGKGFAVIADEIRKLAENSTEHAKIIEQYIKTMLEKINNGVTMTIQAGDAFRKISQGISETTSLIVQISSATGEQNIGTNKVLSSITTVVENSRQIKELIENLNSQSKNINTLMEELITKAIDIDATTEEQAASFSKIQNIIERIRNISTENLKIVTDLQVDINGYKI